mgnify:CR=1 FL=1
MDKFGINIGAMNIRAFLQSNAGTPHAQTGAITDAWANVRGFWCEVMAKAADEKTIQQQQRLITDVDLRCRYAADIRSNKRVLLPRNTATLAAGINSAVTSLTVSSAGLCADDRDTVIRIDDEFLLVTAGFGTTSLTATRGAFGSTAAAHLISVTAIKMAVLEITGVLNVANKNLELILNCKEREHV